MTLPSELPIFPLNVVLFPGMPLPLHIFEERYKAMINRCIQAGHAFGVVLIREGQEVGPPARPHDVGTTAVITHVERLAEGRMNVATIGAERFRIEQIIGNEPYLVARVRPYPLAAPPDPRMPDPAGVRSLLNRYMRHLSQLLHEDYQPDQLPADSLALAFLAAIVLQVTTSEKQRLLEVPTLGGLLRDEVALLRREIGVVEFMARGEPAPTSAFSRN